MKIAKVTSEDPKYPRKASLAVRAGALAAAAVIAAGSAGCTSKPVQLDGDIAVEETPIVTEEPEPTEELELMGDVMVDPGMLTEPTEGAEADPDAQAQPTDDGSWHTMGVPPIEATEIAPESGSEDK